MDWLSLENPVVGADVKVVITLPILPQMPLLFSIFFIETESSKIG